MLILSSLRKAFTRLRPVELRRGFTLIELLLVIGVIAILSAIVIVAINPTKQLADARNAQRRIDVSTILNAVYQYSVDHDGQFPATITVITTEICRSGTNIDCTGLINLNVLTGSYIPSIPVDPSTATETSTKYTILKLGGRITVAAPDAEQGAIISANR